MNWNAYPPTTRFLDLAPYQRQVVLDHLLTLVGWLPKAAKAPDDKAFLPLWKRIGAMQRYICDAPKQCFEPWMGTFDTEEAERFSEFKRSAAGCICQGLETFPSGPRIDANHVGTRLGDAANAGDVFLDGERLNRCVEAYAGTPGWVIEMIEPLHPCGGPVGEIEVVDLAGCCLMRRTGRVEIRTAVPA